MQEFGQCAALLLLLWAYLTQRNHSKVLGVVHQAAELLSTSQRSSGYIGSGSAVIPTDLVSSKPGLWAIVLDRNSPSVCSLSSLFFFGHHITQVLSRLQK